MKMFLSTTEIMEGGWNRRSGGIFPKLAESVDKGDVESDDFRDKLLPVEYEEFPDVNAPKYHEQGTHGQDMPDPDETETTPRRQRQVGNPMGRLAENMPVLYEDALDRHGEDPGVEPDATPDERGLLLPEPPKKRVRDQTSRRGQSSELRHVEDEKIADARAPDAFDIAVQQLGDVTKVAAEMRSQGMEDWVIEERLLRELSTRSLMVTPSHTNYIKGITWEDIESTGDRHKLKERLKSRRRDANRTPEQRKEYLASERERNARRSANRTPEQRVEQRETKTARERERRANRTPEQREEQLVKQRARMAKRRAAKKQEARESTWDDLEAPE